MNGKRIMILEDEALIALDIKMTLEEAGFHNIVVCHNVEQAWEHLEKETPELAFTDVNLGRNVTSFDVGVELKARGCDVVILSGYTGTTVKVPKSLQSSSRLAKPFAEKAVIDLATRSCNARPN